MATRLIRPLTTANFTYTIAALPNIRFTSATGLEEKVSEIIFYDGFNRDPRMLRQEPERPTITLKVPYDPEYIQPIINWFKGFTDAKASILTVQPFRYENGVRKDFTQAFSVFDIQPVSWALPEGTAGGTDVAYLTLVVSGRPPSAQ